MTGAIVDLSKEKPPRELTVDVCVIGSGPGGATAAWELAKAGREVVVLEEGGDFTGTQLRQRDGEGYDQLYMDRGGRTTADMSVSVMQGRVLGGGSVINACDVVPLHDGVLAHWRKQFGLTGFTPETLEPYRAQALSDLGANVPPEAMLNENNRLLRKGAQALGWRGEVMTHNRVGCVGTGACLLGCPANAKRNARFVALPQALSHGARVFTRARVVRIGSPGSEWKRVFVRTLDERGYREQGAFEVQARAVVVAANAIGSAALLLRSGIGNAHVGQHLSLQPQLPVTAVFDHEVRFFRGIPQAYAVTEFEEPADEARGTSGFRLESIGGTPGIVASLLPWSGEQGMSRMREYPNLAGSLLLLPDANDGFVSLTPDGGPRVHYTFSEDLKARCRRAIRAAATLYLEAGAREVLVPLSRPLVLRSKADLAQVDGVTLAPATAPFISAHQQGTVRFAAEPTHGAAAPTGEVYGTRGVYVWDSSGFPTTASSHIMAPIITVSRWLARQWLT